MRSENCVVQFMIDCGGPITRERYISLNYFGNPPAILSGEELAEIADWLPQNDLSYARRSKPTATAIGRARGPLPISTRRRSSASQSQPEPLNASQCKARPRSATKRTSGPARRSQGSRSSSTLSERRRAVELLSKGHASIR